VVRAGSSDTTYIRAGSGPCVLLLVTDVDSPLALVLVESLSTRFRVVAPVTRPADSDFSLWLTPFLDGLGIASASLIAHEGIAAHAIAFALLEPGRIDRVVLIAERLHGDIPELGGALADAVASHDLMVVGASEAPSDVADRIARFLSGASS
jgi:hypothetical protein